MHKTIKTNLFIKLSTSILLTFGFYSVILKLIIKIINKNMATSIIQLTLAIIPAFAISYIIHKMTMPWDKQKREGERAEILSMLAKDIKKAKVALSRNLTSVSSGESHKSTPLSLNNWNMLKYDMRFKKYSDEPLFKEMIKQFKQLERIKTICQ